VTGSEAHGVNLDLGSDLLNGPSSVDPMDMDVAGFFVYALLRSDYDVSSWTKDSDRDGGILAQPPAREHGLDLGIG
jgi:hypothetical protein